MNEHPLAPWTARKLDEARDLLREALHYVTAASSVACGENVTYDLDAQDLEARIDHVLADAGWHEGARRDVERTG